MDSHPEVSFSAITCLQDILQSSSVAGILASSRRYTEMALDVYKAVVDYALEHSKDIDYAVFTVLLESVSALLQGSPDSPSHSSSKSGYIFTSEDVLMFLRLADTLSSVQMDSSSSKSSVRETSFQRATLQLIDKLTYVPGPVHLWGEVVVQVVKYVRGAIPTAPSLDNDKAEPHLPEKTFFSAVLFAFAEKAVPVLVDLYCLKVPTDVRGEISLLSSVVSALLDIMTSPQVPKSSGLCCACIAGFSRTIESGLDALNAFPEQNFGSIRQFWKLLIDGSLGFLSPTCTGTGKEVFEDLQIKMASCIGSVILPRSVTALESEQKVLIDFLAHYQKYAWKTVGYAEASTKYLGVVQACTQGLFALCDSRTPFFSPEFALSVSFH
jgi:hypothetical protein